MADRPDGAQGSNCETGRVRDPADSTTACAPGRPVAHAGGTAYLSAHLALPQSRHETDTAGGSASGRSPSRLTGPGGNPAKGGTLILMRRSHLTRAGCLSSTFGNSAPKTKTLVSRLNRGVYEVSRRPESTAPKDDRGPVVRTVETAQTFLTAVEVDALVGDYLAGMSVKSLAETYGIHRATVCTHLRRRNVPTRRPGMVLDEKAEAVRLARAGVSVRAIARRMGVDRKAVRRSLVEACVIDHG